MIASPSRRLLSCDGVVGYLPHRTLLGRLSDRYQRLALWSESPQPRILRVLND